MPPWLFFSLAMLAILSALGVILQANPVHCLLGLAINLLDIGLLFIGLGAVTIGFLQIIIYVGAIMVLFLFVIWLLNLQAEGLRGYLGLKFFGAIGAAALTAELAVIFLRQAPISRLVTASATQSSISNLGQALFSDYLIAFEVTSILLLAAVVGAIGLARRIPPSADIEHRSQMPTAIPASARADSNRRERTSA
ncbi:MAG: NADH-quinone oxidoreductase subunit J [Deltaproteobacteria bacterium]|nr:NADH-quinone oxidoreductase subunit J [Deltaproteobacteria bacterium]MBV8454920.1 NADH-quinone oxidoreductase subunit J [Deltaproteobacteria bacterium]